MSGVPRYWKEDEDADVTRLREVWGDQRLGVVLGDALGEYNRLGTVKAEYAAARLGVSASTVRRWVRNGVPEARMADVVHLVRPPRGAFEQERRDLAIARSYSADYRAGRSPFMAEWQRLGWVEPHLVAIVAIRGTSVLVARIANANGDVRSKRRLSAGGEVVELVKFRTKFHADAARLELLEDVHDWRLQLPPGRVSRGGGKAWLAEAPRKGLERYRRYPRRTRKLT